MGSDISEGAKIGVILVILVALIAIVFTLVAIMKDITASGSQSLQNGLQQLADSQFDDYDQKIKTGTDVKAAVKIFEGKPIAVVVVTQGNIKASGNAAYSDAAEYTALQYGAILENAAALAANNTITSEAAGQVATVKVKGLTDSAEPATVASNAILTKYKGNNYYTGALKTDANGQIIYNMNMKPLDVSGKQSYVRTSSDFQAELIKDPTGTKIGIVFRQLN